MTRSTGALVGIRHPSPVDAPEFMALRQASHELHAPWEPTPEPGMEAMGPLAFARLLATADSAQFQKHLVYRLSDQRIVGYVALNEIVRGAFRSAHLGYWTGSPFTRSGYGAEGVRLCIARAFGDLELHRVEANIIPANDASRALARRCGLMQEGLSPRYLKIAGAWRDHERWAVTSEVWSDVPSS